MDASKTVEVIERIKMIEVAEQEVARKKCELDSKVLKPAEAEKIKTQVLAQANHEKCVIEAEGVAAALEMKVKEITCLIGIVTLLSCQGRKITCSFTCSTIKMKLFALRRSAALDG